MSESRPHILFVTGKLAEPALRRVLEAIAPQEGFIAEVQVLNITVAALLTTSWVARHLVVPPGIDRVVLPGLCRGELTEVVQSTGRQTELGPKDLRDLPEFFGKGRAAPPDLTAFDIEILAEVNHAPSKSEASIVEEARRYVASGANIIDLGCDPGHTWEAIGEAVRTLRSEGIRVSVDSFNPVEVAGALAGGAELVLSVNSSNLHHARNWARDFPHVEVIAIPDTPDDLPSLVRTANALAEIGIKFRLDPILEPIGFGFAASLGRYAEVRKMFPDAEILMGVGNLTELTEVDSAGINVLLAGFCQELGIRSVLTTQVSNWCRSAVREFALARQIIYHAIHEKVVPKRLSSDLVMLRDPKVHEYGEVELRDLSQRITDRNYRLFSERGELHVLSSGLYFHGNDPFELFAKVLAAEPEIEASHSFYLGYEFAKAFTALTLGKNYTQDQVLRWGLLTVPECPTYRIH